MSTKTNRYQWGILIILMFISSATVVQCSGAISQTTLRPWNQLPVPSFDFSQRETLYVGGSGPGNYTKIQQAVDNASSNDIIFVYQGTYFEHVLLNKKVTLQGESRDQTIIDGSGTGNVVKIVTDGVQVQQFTLQNGGIGLYVVHSSNHTIIQNKITDNWEGIGLLDSSHSVISRNIITKNGFEGINPIQTTFSLFSDNTIVDHLQGIYLIESTGNTIVGNNFYSNSRGVDIQEASNTNSLYHNNFFTSSENNAYDKCSNSWDDGYPSGGNYWDDYSGGDADHDGIGDTPYNIDGGAGNKDFYPLMEPWNHPPYQPSDPFPFSGATNVPVNPELSVFVFDPEGDVMDVSFYNAETHQLIASDTDVQSSTRASVTWNGLQNVTLYRWYAIADDGENTNQSEVWEFTTGSGVNHAPETPSIDGNKIGTIGYTYEYTLVTTDPDSDDVWYYVDWGDDTNSGWVGLHLSGEPITLPHTWEQRGTYTVKVKAKDVYDAESEWGSILIIMPKSNAYPMYFFIHFFEKLIQQFPCAFPVLQFLFSLDEPSQ